MKTWHHIIVWAIVGYLAGYYFRGLGNMTVGRFIKGA